MTVLAVDLIASEALFAFMSWLSTLDEVTIASAKHDAKRHAELIAEFCLVNALEFPRADFVKKKIRYPVRDPEADPKPAEGIECRVCSVAAGADRAVTHLPPACPDPTSIEEAWVVIANATDWDTKGREEWKAAAERWRDSYITGGSKGGA